MEKKVLIIIASKDFKDEEYFVTKQILEKAQIKTKTASDKNKKALGSDGGEVNIDFSIQEKVNLDPFDAIVFIGGPGCLNKLDNENSYKIAKETINKKKVLAAICISPIILAKAGVLKNKKATVWSSSMDKSATKTLEKEGAIYLPEKVVQDGCIITADGPKAAKFFGEKIVKLLTKK